jgi:ankyrin repeat protein
MSVIFRRVLVTCLFALWSVSANAHAAPKPTPDMLTQAASRGDLKRVRQLLARGVPIDAHDTHDLTALQMAAFGYLDRPAANVPGREAVIKYLLSHQADPNAHPKGGGYTALMFAIANGSPAMVRTLIDGGADVNAHQPDGYTVLETAVLASRLPIIRMLVSHGALLWTWDADGLTPLALARRAGDSQVVAELTRDGAAL